MAKNLLIKVNCLISFIIFNLNLYSREINFELDVIQFKSDSIPTQNKLDCFVIIPYNQIKFNKSGSSYFSNLQVILEFEQNGSIIESKVKDIIKKVDDYFKIEGGEADFIKITERFNLNEGKYKFNVRVFDNNSKVISSKTKEINLVNYDNYDFGLSGIMTLSSIEEKENGYKITPFFNQNIYKIKKNFFIFFEIYSKINTNAYVYYEFKKDDEIITGKFIEVNLFKKNIQKFINISDYKLVGNYFLKLYLLQDSINMLNENNILAVTEKEYNFTPSFYMNILENLDLSIRQMRYVTEMEIINQMLDLPTSNEKIEAFMNFWNNLDPSPNTEFNESLDEYYNRINYAITNFKSYSDGWLTDMGMIYTTLGPPISATRNNQNMSSRITYEIWTYNNGLEFVFEDKSGFGDFRLIRPFGFNKKYEYKSR